MQNRNRNNIVIVLLFQKFGWPIVIDGGEPGDPYTPIIAMAMTA